jgi:hypothetical protein
MDFHIMEASIVSDFKILLSFKDGSTGEVDLENYSREDSVFKKFRDRKFFKSFRVEFGTLVWGNDASEEIDISPEQLYFLATGKKVKYKATRNAV